MTVGGGTRVLTIWQPWASLIAHGIKRHELRTWAPPAALLNCRLLIHAGKRRIRDDDLPARWRKDFERRLGPLGALPRGGIIADSEIDDVFTVLRHNRGPACQARNERTGETEWIGKEPWGDYRKGIVVWQLTDVGRLCPSSCDGKPGLWRPPPELAWL